MSDREEIEEQIRTILVSETRAISLSNRLFSLGGMFNQLAKTAQERRLVAQSVLFQQAQRRLSELQQKEAAEFDRLVNEVQAVVRTDDCLLKLERVETSWIPARERRGGPIVHRLRQRRGARGGEGDRQVLDGGDESAVAVQTGGVRRKAVRMREGGSGDGWG